MSRKLKFIFMLLCLKVRDGQANKAKIDPKTEHGIEHLKEDLDSIIGKKPEDMTNKELEFHYFHQHDYDKDKSLDGNEIVMSLFHLAKSNPGQTTQFLSDDELIFTVDDVLKVHDENNDGKISYQEYITPLQPTQ